jgi:N-acetylmuramic acid 6-phosphate etherase
MNREQPNTIDHLTTEARNPQSAHIDALAAIDIVRLMNQQDAEVATAVAAVAPQIAEAVDVIADRIRNGGRLIYIGAGTSGRLGVLDASECPPTFNTSPDLVIGLIAGGNAALTRAIEGAEDLPEHGQRDLAAVGLSAQDVVVGIATSGRTPYVIGGLIYAGKQGAYTIGFSCNAPCEMSRHAQLMISPIVGPEVITGSTRMKAGTATKMVLNMLTTGAMVRLGKTYGHLMVDLRATNEKLTQRSQRIVAEMTGLDRSAAQSLLQQCDGEVKTSIVAHKRAVAPQHARELLRRADGHLRKALEEMGSD